MQSTQPSYILLSALPTPHTPLFSPPFSFSPSLLPFPFPREPRPRAGPPPLHQLALSAQPRLRFMDFTSRIFL